MNIANILKLADFLDMASPEPEFNNHLGEYVYTFANGEGYSMGIWDSEGRTCNTVGCIGGWAAAFAKEDGDYSLSRRSAAQNWLGITLIQDTALFTPMGWHSPEHAKEYTPQRAARVLRHLAATGNVDWSV